VRRVAFYTLGCKVNQYETEAMRELFTGVGDTIVDSEAVADIYVINTCTVTGMSDKKSRQFIRRCRRLNPEALIAVVGCYSQIAPAEVMAIEGVNLVLGTSQRNRIVELLDDMTSDDRREQVTDIMKIREFEEMTVDTIESRTRAFIKIQDGCDRYCSYCIIPYARGPVRSRASENVLAEVERLASKGFREVVLTGIHVASYGKDCETETLIGLLTGINKTPGLERIRLSSLEPVLLTEPFMHELAKNKKICPHFHISLQSGCDSVLKRMNRRYTADEYLEIVHRVRAYYPLAAITTDIIAGFPGETEEEFEATMKFVERVGFSQIHVFGFSPREGTPAATMPDPIRPEIRQQRVEQLMKLGARLEEQYMKLFIGKTMRVLVEKNESGGIAEGLTENYLRVLLPKGDYEPGTEIDVVVIALESGALRAMVV